MRQISLLYCFTFYTYHILFAVRPQNPYPVRKRKKMQICKHYTEMLTETIVASKLFF